MIATFMAGIWAAQTRSPLMENHEPMHTMAHPVTTLPHRTSAGSVQISVASWTGHCDPVRARVG
jgi:hypothetical protein